MNILNQISAFLDTEGIVDSNLKSRILIPANRVIPLINKIKEVLPEFTCTTCGSIRREILMIRDIDLVILPNNNLDNITNINTIKNRLKSIRLEIMYETYNSIVAISDKEFDYIRIDILICNTHNYGIAVTYMTGSKLFNDAIRRIAEKSNMSFHPMYIKAGKNQLTATSEKEVFDILNIKWVDPVHRTPGIYLYDKNDNIIDFS